MVIYHFLCWFKFFIFFLWSFKVHENRGGFKGGPGGWRHPLVKIRGLGGTPCASHPPDWSSEGCRGPPCDIWHFWQWFLYNLHKLHLLKIKFTKILISLFNIVIYVWFLTPLLLLVIRSYQRQFNDNLFYNCSFKWRLKWI